MPDALFDLRHNSRRVAFHNLLNVRPKFVQQIHPRVIANGRTKIAERLTKETASNRDSKQCPQPQKSSSARNTKC